MHWLDKSKYEKAKNARYLVISHRIFTYTLKKNQTYDQLLRKTWHFDCIENMKKIRTDKDEFKQFI